MSDQVSSNPEASDSQVGSEEEGQSSEGAPASVTKPKSGEVTADDSKRFLSEIVAFHGLSKVGDTIASSMDGVDEGGILIVDDLSFAINDIFYLDIRKKLDTLVKLLADVSKKCHDFSMVEKKSEFEDKNLNRLFSFSVGLGLGGVTTAAAAISGGLSAIGDIIGYFRSDYVIKGQTLGNVDDIYIQALVAEKLRKMKKDVYLLNFHLINQSQLLNDLKQLFEQKLIMLTCSEMIKSNSIDTKEVMVQALETHLVSLRVKLVEYLVKVDDDIIETLRREIDLKTVQLKGHQDSRMPDSQITALETYLSNLRLKLVDVLIKDNVNARTTLEDEIKQIIKQLEENQKAAPDKKLSDIQVKALSEQLKLLQTRLVEVLVTIGNNTKETLEREIDRVNNLLRECQKNRVPDSQITALEAHLASLKTSLIECLVKNDEDAKTNLEAEIDRVIRLIGENRKHMQEAKGIVNSSEKLSEAIDTFITNITTVPSNGTYPPYVIACVREYIAGDRIKYILKIKLISSGADFIIEKPPFYSRNVNTSYLGGGVVSYIMAEKDGKIVASGTVADVAALDHKIGKAPKLLKWRIHKE